VRRVPRDAALAERLSQLEQGLDPSERRRVATSKVESTGSHQSPMHEAESLAAAGRYKDAITIYRTLLVQRPDWELVKERLAELFQLAQVAEPKRQPVNRARLLEHLLERISSRKRADRGRWAPRHSRQSALTPLSGSAGRIGRECHTLRCPTDTCDVPVLRILID